MAGIDEPSTRLAQLFTDSFCDSVTVTSQPEVCETSKLLENSFRTVGISLVSEITRLCDTLGISAMEVCQAAATKQHGYFPFYPGPGIGGHCLPNDQRILAASFRQHDIQSDLLSTVIRITQSMPRIFVDRCEAILVKQMQTIATARVLMVGVGFKAGTSDTTSSPALQIGAELVGRGAQVSYIDSLIKEIELPACQIDRLESSELETAQFDLAVIVAGDTTVSIDQLSRAANVVVDASGAIRAQRNGVQ